MLARSLKQSFNFSIMNAFKGIRDAVRAPVKHVKSMIEPSGGYYSPQTNTTEEAFDEVSHEWQVRHIPIQGLCRQQPIRYANL